MERLYGCEDGQQLHLLVVGAKNAVWGVVMDLLAPRTVHRHNAEGIAASTGAWQHGPVRIDHDMVGIKSLHPKQSKPAGG